MFDFEDLTTHSLAQERLARPRLYGYTSKAQDQMVAFTLSEAAARSAARNMERLKQFAQECRADYFVIKRNMIQFVGTPELDDDRFINKINTKDFAARQEKYFENNKWHHNQYKFISTISDQGLAIALHQYGVYYFSKSYYGVYNTQDFKKMKRHDVIDNFWRLGFPTRRGNPLSVSRSQSSGSKQDVVELQNLYANHFRARSRSAISARYCQIYSQFKKEFIWPGMI